MVHNIALGSSYILGFTSFPLIFKIMKCDRPPISLYWPYSLFSSILETPYSCDAQKLCASRGCVPVIQSM